MRGNLNKFADVADVARIVTGPVTPVIEDAAFAAAALEVLPEVIDAGAWSAWTTAVKDKTGAKGKGLFMPLRLALTGQAHGPDMAAMAPLIGRDAIVRRLKGEAG
ncbi:Glutamate--tRNA ligase [compost metagenome]